MKKITDKNIHELNKEATKKYTKQRSDQSKKELLERVFAQEDCHNKDLKMSYEKIPEKECTDSASMTSAMCSLMNILGNTQSKELGNTTQLTVG